MLIERFERIAKYLSIILMVGIGIVVVLPRVLEGGSANTTVPPDAVNSNSSASNPQDESIGGSTGASLSDPQGRPGAATEDSEAPLLPRLEPETTYLSVPDEFPTIQDAINAANDGETVLVAPGTYFENLELEGKNITLASHFLTTQDFSIIESTVIDGGGKDFVLSVAEDVGPGTTITGFTFRNADDGILSFGEIIFTFNHVTEVADGIDFEGGGGLVQNNRFDFNRDDGIDLDDETAVIIENNWIADNEDDGIEIRFHPYEGPTLQISILSNWIGGNQEDGIQLIDYEGLSNRNLLIQDNLIINNAMAGIGSTRDGNTVENFEGSSSIEPTYIFNNTFVGNNHALTGGDRIVALNNLFVDSGAIAVRNVDSQSNLAHNLFWGNSTDSINSNVDINTTLQQDPLLDPESYAPRPGSPAINSGANLFSWLGELVMVLPEQSYFGTARDLGAFETSPKYRRTKLDPNNFYIQSPSFYGIDSEIDPASPAELMPDLSTIIQNSNPASLVQSIETSLFAPPSPDPAGITYVPISNQLLVSDSEVNEWDSYTGENQFTLELSGQQTGAFGAFPFTDEPSGLEYNPTNNHLFVSDDVQKEVFDVDPGADGLFGTLDDIVSSFSTHSFGGDDPEGVAFNSLTGELYLANGVNSEIFRISPGLNGRFDGVPPEGDDEVSNFDTSTFGLQDVEGIAFALNTGNLLVVGRPGDILLEMTTTGQIVRMIDISEANPVFPASVTVAPASNDPSKLSVYITDRGLSILNVPDAIDGRIYELSLPPISPGNQPPVVSATADLFDAQDGTTILRSRVSDDGVPTPNPLVPRVSVWKQLSGPGTAEFSGLNATDVLVNFPYTGIYVFRAIASDGELVSSDDVTVVVTEGLDKLATVSRIETGADDAEERSTGRVRLDSQDLELGFINNAQHVGLRFNGVFVPKGAQIVDAYIQFEADAPDSEPASLAIEGHDVGNAGAFTTLRWNIAFRVRTSASVLWSPNPWTFIGESGLDQRTPNIAPIIQEIIDRSDWKLGNSMVFLITPSGATERRAAVSFEGNTSSAPMLYIEYELPGSENFNARSN